VLKAERQRSGRAGQARPVRNRARIPPLPGALLIAGPLEMLVIVLEKSVRNPPAPKDEEHPKRQINHRSHS
jgi:hypothetical protein